MILQLLDLMLILFCLLLILILLLMNRDKYEKPHNCKVKLEQYANGKAWCPKCYRMIKTKIPEEIIK